MTTPKRDLTTGGSLFLPSARRSSSTALRVGPTPQTFPRHIAWARAARMQWRPRCRKLFATAFLDRLSVKAIETLAKYHRSAATCRCRPRLHVHQLGGAVRRVADESTAFTDPFAVTGLGDPGGLPRHERVLAVTMPCWSARNQKFLFLGLLRALAAACSNISTSTLRPPVGQRRTTSSLSVIDSGPIMRRIVCMI